MRELSCLMPFAAASAAASVRSLLNAVFTTVLRLFLVCLNHTDTSYGIVLHRVAFMYVLCCATLRLSVAAAGTCIARVAFGIAVELMACWCGERSSSRRHQCIMIEACALTFGSAAASKSTGGCPGHASTTGSPSSQASRMAFAQLQIRAAASQRR